MTTGSVPTPRRARRVTIADVARVADVSQSAVSFALNDRPGVSQATRDRILRVAAELGWQPSVRARALATGRADAVGFILARPAHLFASDPYFGQFLFGLESVLSAEKQALVLQVVSAGDRAEEEAAYRRMADGGRVDGFVLIDGREDDSRFPLLRELGLPAVIGGDVPADSPFPGYGSDVAAGTRAAVEHLLELGHRRIDYVSGPLDVLHARRRYDAWVATLEDNGATGVLVESDFTEQGGIAATEELLRRSADSTAIVYANDVMAIAGMAVLRATGRRVPDDVSVVGYDDIPLAAHTGPPLSTVRQDIIGNGRVVAARLLSVTMGSEIETPPFWEPMLVARRSSAAPAERGA